MVRVSTKSNSKSVNAATKLTLYKINALCSICSLIFFICSGLCLLLSFKNTDGVFKPDLFAEGTIFLFIAIFLLPPIFIKVVLKVRNVQNKANILIAEDTIQEYIFEESKFSVDVIKSGAYNNHIVMEYSGLYKVREYKDSWRIMPSVSAAFIVLKADIVEGDVSLLNKIFVKAIDPKKLKLLK